MQGVRRRPAHQGDRRLSRRRARRGEVSPRAAGRARGGQAGDRAEGRRHRRQRDRRGGPYRRAGRRRAGVETRCCAMARRSRSNSLEELLDVAMQLSSADLSRLPAGRGVAAITFGGGSGVLSADQCDRAGLAVPALSRETLAALAGAAPPLASTPQPGRPHAADLSRSAMARPFPARARRHRRRSGGRDAVLPAWADGERRSSDGADGRRVPRALPEAGGRGLAADDRSGGRLSCDRNRCTSFPNIRARCGRSGGSPAMPRRCGRGAARRPRRRSTGPPQLPAPQRGAVISEPRCHAILARAGLSRRRRTIGDLRGRRRCWRPHEVGFPVAMKGISAAVTHRAAAGLLALSLNSR